MLKLNLGSGQRPFQGSKKEPWINIDKQEKWKPDLIWDISTGLPYEECQAEIIVLHHVLEHFGVHEGHMLLRECYRVLGKSGKLLVFVPDLYALSDGWRSGKLDDYGYLVNVYGANMGTVEDLHKWGYSCRNLTAALYESGFRVMDRLTGVEVRKHSRNYNAALTYDWWMLVMEAVK